MFTERQLTDAIPMLTRYARKIVRCDQDDLVQDTLLRAWNKRQQYQEGNFGGWLRSIMHNQHVARVRVSDKETRRNAKLLTDGIQQPVQEIVLQVKEAIAAVEKLSAVQRNAIHDVAFREMTYDESAALRGTIRLTIATRLHRARQQLA